MVYIIMDAVAEYTLDLGLHEKGKMFKPNLRSAFLKTAREARGLSLYQTAKRLGISPFELKRVENGDVIPSYLLILQAESIFFIGLYSEFVSRRVAEYRQTYRKRQRFKVLTEKTFF